MSHSDLQRAILASSLKDKWAALASLARNSVRATPKPGKEEAIPIGASKLGGNPDLPSAFPWPVTREGAPLAFVAQMDFAAASAFDRDGLLPQQGLASFFYSHDQESWGFDPCDADKFKVVYFPSPAGLERREPPENLPEEGRFHPCSLELGPELSLPDPSDDRLDAFLVGKDADAYADLVDAGTRTKLLGYPDLIQNEMELECALVTHGLYCGDSTGYEDPRRAEYEGEVPEWILLLQVDSEEEAGMMWGDCGRLYFWIKKQDLAARNFDGAWQILQCS